MAIDKTAQLYHRTRDYGDLVASHVNAAAIYLRFGRHRDAHASIWRATTTLIDLSYDPPVWNRMYRRRRSTFGYDAAVRMLDMLSVLAVELEAISEEAHSDRQLTAMCQRAMEPHSDGSIVWLLHDLMDASADLY